jgi:DNA mismatch endonuclease (patch repair protein)
MSDIYTKAKRSEIMSRIRSHGNRDTELALARLLRRQGITGWRRGQPVFGKPDFVFRQARLAVFVDGCFWHGCPKHATKPKNNRAFWHRKLSANKARDRLVGRALRSAHWRVLRIWEHQLAKLNAKGQRLEAEHRTSNIQHPTSNVYRLVQRIQRALK